MYTLIYSFKFQVEQIEGVLKSIDVTDRVYIPSKQKDQLMTLGIPRRVQKAVAFLVRFFAVLAIFGLFYGYVGFSVYFYANLESLDRLRNHEEIFVNVIGHLGWLYADAMSPELMTYVLHISFIIYFIHFSSSKMIT